MRGKENQKAKIFLNLIDIPVTQSCIYIRLRITDIHFLCLPGRFYVIKFSEQTRARMIVGFDANTEVIKKKISRLH